MNVMVDCCGLLLLRVLDAIGDEQVSFRLTIRAICAEASPAASDELCAGPPSWSHERHGGDAAALMIDPVAIGGIQYFILFAGLISSYPVSVQHPSSVAP